MQVAINYPPYPIIRSCRQEKEREHGLTKNTTLLDVPHIYFPLPKTLAGVRSRESIKVRALVFLYPTI
jgi:hypothetical protein